MAEAQDHMHHHHNDDDQEEQYLQQPKIRDVALWRRNKVFINAAILLVSTASWVLLQLYRISALTLLSYTAIFLLSLLFLWGTILRLLRKEGPDLRRMEISEQQMLEGAYTCKAACEGALKWMLHLTVEGDWLHFTCTVAALLLLSYVATFFELPTLIYIGIIMGMSVPVVYGDRMKVIHNVKEKLSGKKSNEDKKED